MQTEIKILYVLAYLHININDKVVAVSKNLIGDHRILEDENMKPTLNLSNL